MNQLLPALVMYNRTDRRESREVSTVSCGVIHHADTSATTGKMSTTDTHRTCSSRYTTDTHVHSHT